MMSDNDSVSSASSDEDVVAPKAVEAEKPKRKGRGKAKAKSAEEKVEEVVAAAVAPAPKAKRTKKVKVPDEPVVEEIPEHMGGEPIKKARKTRAKSADVEPYKQVTKEGMEEFKTKSKAKKAPEPVPEPVAEELPVSVQRNGKKKREIGPEERERLLANLARGRETRKKNFEAKRAEQAKLIEAAKVKIAEPIIKEVHHHYEKPATPVKKAAPRAAAKPAVQMPVFV